MAERNLMVDQTAECTFARALDQAVNQVVAVPAHRLQVLDLVGLAWGSAADG